MNVIETYHNHAELVTETVAALIAESRRADDKSDGSRGEHRIAAAVLALAERRAILSYGDYSTINVQLSPNGESRPLTRTVAYTINRIARELGLRGLDPIRGPRIGYAVFRGAAAARIVRRAVRAGANLTPYVAYFNGKIEPALIVPINRA